MHALRLPREEAQAALAVDQRYPYGEALCNDWMVDTSHHAEPFLTASSRIVTLGSCFAVNVRSWLTRRDYCVHNLSGRKKPEQALCQIYSTAGLRQEIARTFDGFTPQEARWKTGPHLLDPYRHLVAWDNADDAAKEQTAYVRRLRRALVECNVLILTVGQNEVWYNKDTESRRLPVYSMVPPDGVYDPNQHVSRTMSYAENLRNLEECFTVFDAHNKAARIIVAVSPVPLKATWQNMDAVTANGEGKAILRAAVGAFVQRHRKRVFYFPSYELVTAVNRNAYKPDNRHVTPETVAGIMAVFARWFVE